MLDNNTITNNYIHHVAVEYESAAAISIGHPRNVRIANNEICYFPYSGMHIGYGWDAVVTSKMSGIVIENNYLHDFFQGEVHDGGGIYTIGATGATKDNPNIIRGNVIERVGPGAAGIYNDQGSSNWLVENNVVDFRDTFKETGYFYPKWCNVNITDAAYRDRNLIWRNNYSTLKLIFTPYRATHPDSGNSFEGSNYLDETTGMWPAAAYTIIDEAGITDEYKDNFRYGLQDLRVVEEVGLSAGESFTNTPCMMGSKDTKYKSNGLVINVTSSNEAVATADIDTITAVAAGTAVITYSVIENGIIVKATTTVTVK